MDYLCWRWKTLQLDRELSSFDESAVAVARLCIGVQTPEMAKIICRQFTDLDDEQQDILTQELVKL